MVQLFKPGRKGQSKKGQSKKGGHAHQTQAGNQIESVRVDAMDHQGKGVVRGDKVTFVEGAISGEVCKIHRIQQQKGIRQAQVLEVLQASPHRQVPFCPHFEQCGGCQTQHIQHHWLNTQKQQALGVSLQKALRQGGVAGELPWQASLLSKDKGYRRKARLAVDARKSNDIKLGFRDDKNQVFNLTECQILEPELQSLIAPLQELVRKLKSKKTLGHISLFNGNCFSHGDNDVQDMDAASAALNFRFTKELTDGDRALLQEFARVNGIIVQVQCNEQMVQNLLAPGDAVGEVQPGYLLNIGTTKSIKIALNPNDFVQINSGVNQKMIARTMDWLAIEKEDRVLDLFCGVGNFSLAMATQCQQVVGFEGVPEMVQNARANAQRNGIDNVSFLSGDLTNEDFLRVLRQQNCNKVVLDPARAGALKVMDSLRYLAPEAIVYVSCNPATFGRDIAKLLEKSRESNYKNHYQLVKLSLVDMFPNTSHSEIMGLFRLHG